MEARPTDPRCLVTEIETFVFRVDFWDKEHPVSDEWLISGAELDEALKWADDHAGGRSCSLYVFFGESSRLTGIRRL